MTIRAVIFDLDGVIIESEQLWDDARREVAADHGGQWRDDATTVMQGMSSVEWGAYLHDALGVDLPAHEIIDSVVENLLDRYREHVPLLPGATDAVARLGTRWPLALASSANRVVIDAVLAITGLADAFAATVSSEEVPNGKPAPDVYREAARRLGVAASRCAAVEDSANGIRSALAAGCHVVAVPNAAFPPGDVLSEVGVVLHDLGELTVDAVERLDD